MTINIKSGVVIEKPTVEWLRKRYDDAGIGGQFCVRDHDGLAVVQKRTTFGGRLPADASGAQAGAGAAGSPAAEARAAGQPVPVQAAGAPGWEQARAWARHIGAKADVAPLPSESIQALVAARGMPWRSEYLTRTVPYFGSDERVDQMGDIVRQSWQFDVFEKNSPMPFSHDWGMPPVGRCIFWDVVNRKDGDYSGPALVLLGLFMTKEDWEWADTVFRLVDARVLVSGSVGFFPDRVIDVKDDKERAALGLGKWGLVFEDNHLLEYSPTTIPANSGANVAQLVSAAAKHLQPHDLHVVRELQRERIYGTKGDRAKWIEAESALLSVARRIWPEERFEFHKDLDVPVTLEERPVSKTVKTVDELLKAPPPPPPPPAGGPPPANPPAPAPGAPADPLVTLNEIHAMIKADVAANDQFRNTVLSLLNDIKGGKKPETPPAAGDAPPAPPQPPAKGLDEATMTNMDKLSKHLLGDKPKT